MRHLTKCGWRWIRFSPPTSMHTDDTGRGFKTRPSLLKMVTNVEWSCHKNLLTKLKTGRGSHPPLAIQYLLKCTSTNDTENTGTLLLAR